jgi:hypothetical protein
MLINITALADYRPYLVIHKRDRTLSGQKKSLHTGYGTGDTGSGKAQISTGSSASVGGSGTGVILQQAQQIPQCRDIKVVQNSQIF